MTKIETIKQWLKDTETKYDTHSVYRNGIIMYDLAEENKRLFIEKTTLTKVLSILEEK